MENDILESLSQKKKYPAKVIQSIESALDFNTPIVEKKEEPAKTEEEHPADFDDDEENNKQEEEEKPKERKTRSSGGVLKKDLLVELKFTLNKLGQKFSASKYKNCDLKELADIVREKKKELGEVERKIEEDKKTEEAYKPKHDAKYMADLMYMINLAGVGTLEGLSITFKDKLKGVTLEGWTEYWKNPEKKQQLTNILVLLYGENPETIDRYGRPIAVWMFMMATSAAEVRAANAKKNSMITSNGKLEDSN